MIKLLFVLLAGSLQSSVLAETVSRPDVLTEDVLRFSKLLSSSVPDRRIEGIEGLSDLKYWPAEELIVPLVADHSAQVQREAVRALGRIATVRSIPILIERLDSADWQIRQNAWLALCRITSESFAADQKAAWKGWWQASSSNLWWRQLGRVAASPDLTREQRRARIRALPHLAGPSAEPELIGLLKQPRQPALDPSERAWICEALERIGSVESIQTLAAERTDAAAWALGRIGGAEAELALLQFPKTLPVLLALDRLHSTNAAPFIPFLVSQVGLITYRGQPDDVMNEELQPIQRVAARLIQRSGQAPVFIEVVLQELEDSMSPKIEHGPRPECPGNWNRMFVAMREELKPGFVRGDGLTTSQPLAAMCYTAEDPALVTRLIPLLRHPAFVARVYVALTLGRLHAAEALPEIIRIVREGYSFSDATAIASGKHFDQSQTVRWRGFLCMAAGRLGTDSAREALEQLAADPAQPRDVRYSSVVGLEFISSPKSLPVLRRVAETDIIWMTRDAAHRAAAQISLLVQEGK